jgi:hypothetical protein
MLGERSKLERFPIWGEGRIAIGGPRGINTLRSRIVTTIFQSRNLWEKSRNFWNLKPLLTVACTDGTSENKLGTSEQENNRGKQQQVSLLKEWVGIKDRYSMSTWIHHNSPLVSLFIVRIVLYSNSKYKKINFSKEHRDPYSCNWGVSFHSFAHVKYSHTAQ